MPNSSTLHSDSGHSRSPRTPHPWTDRLGVFAAAACAVHCMAAPLVLAFAPLIGGIWASPRTHWVFAAISIPAAVSLLIRNLRGQSPVLRRWLIGLAVAGSLLVVFGLAVPGASWSQGVGIEIPAADWMPAADAGGAAEGCQDACCASVHTSTSGASTFHLPLASIVTMLGGMMLVVAHVVSLRATACCDS